MIWQLWSQKDVGLARQPWVQLPVPPTQYAELGWQQNILSTPLLPHLRTVSFGRTWVPPVQSGARIHRQEKQHSSLVVVNRISDVGKELPKDAEILDFLDTDILGLATNPERPFDFVTSEVRTQLAHLPTPQVDEILTLLGGFESTVFETRAMPRMPPKRQLDMDITETLDARPVAMRHYPVATQQMPKLERQIKARCGYYSRKCEFVRISRLICPKKRW